MVYHQPVLLHQVLSFFDPQPGKYFIDATLGNAGHTIALLEKGASVYGIDQDPENLELANNRIRERGLGGLFHPINSNFSNLAQIIKDIHQPLNGVLFDLGLSTNQLKSSNRGFSFNDESSLDMRLDKTHQDLTAEYIINTYDHQELFDIFSKIAQENYSRDLASLIIKKRQRHPIKSAAILSDIIKEFYQQKRFNPTIHPATKILMALRIVVNQEYENIKIALTSCLSLNQATIQVITFHSGEDRIVKQFIRNNNLLINTLTPKPVKPDFSEIKNNPLSRSSLLRVFKIK